MTEQFSEQAGFPLTRLSVLEGVRSASSDERQRALDRLCEAYWIPVYKYVRLRWNQPIEDAQDLVQGFFAELVERRLLNRFDPGKSRLRTYLRLCVDSFVLNEDKAARRQKRGGEVAHLALDFSGAEEELSGSTIDPGMIASPESLEEFFEKEWIRSLFAFAVEELGALCSDRGRERAFRLFEAYDLSEDENISYEQLARNEAIAIAEVTNTLAWARREFRGIALARLREICGSEEEFARESKAVFGRERK
jgi:RNA polymerase sigma factor (sigma-70 family)